MRYSSNYNLYLPEGSDFVTPEQYNANFEAIDGKLKTIESGSAAKTHTHGPGDLTGVLPVQKGGTGQSSAEKALYALINGSSNLTSTGLAEGDFIAVGDTSAGAGKKVSIAELLAFATNKMSVAKVVTGSYDGTGLHGAAHPNELRFSFVPKLIWIFGMTYKEKDASGDDAYQMMFYGDVRPLVMTSLITTEFRSKNGFQLCKTSSMTRGSAIKKSPDGKVITWYGGDNLYQGSDSGYRYHYMAIG